MESAAAFRIRVLKNHLERLNKVQVNLASTEAKGCLTEEQLKFYNDNGYLLIKGLVERDVIDKCRKQFVDICNKKIDSGMILKVKEIALLNSGRTGEELINKIQDILYDDVFALYIEHPKLLDIVGSLIGSNIVAVHTMLINKPPGTTRHPSHQDLHYFPFRPANYIIASWTAMERVYKDNGCLYVLPSSHKPGNLYSHDYLTHKDGKINGGYHGIQNEDEIAPKEKWLHVEMDVGDTIFFHPLLVHGSGPNVTKNYRKAISAHYANSICNYIDVKGTTQENIAKEFEALAEKKGFKDINYQKIWQMRSKLVRGERINL